MWSPVSIVALVIIVIGSLGVVLLMTNLIPGFGVMEEERPPQSNMENPDKEGSETDD